MKAFTPFKRYSSIRRYSMTAFMPNFSAATDGFIPSFRTCWQVLILNFFVYVLFILNTFQVIISFTLLGVRFYYTTFFYYLFTGKVASETQEKMNSTKRKAAIMRLFFMRKNDQKVRKVR